METPDKITFRYELDPKDELDELIRLLLKVWELRGLGKYITIMAPINPFARVPYREITIENPLDFIKRTITFTEMVPNNAGGKLKYMLETLIKIAYYATQHLDYEYASREVNLKGTPELSLLLYKYSDTLMKRALRINQNLAFRLSRMPESVLHQRSFIIHK